MQLDWLIRGELTDMRANHNPYAIITLKREKKKSSELIESRYNSNKRIDPL